MGIKLDMNIVRVRVGVGVGVGVRAPNDLQLPLRQWGAGNVYLLVLSKAKR